MPVDKRMTTFYIVECPSCKEHMRLKGDYSREMETSTKCKHCGFIAAGYNFDYIDSTIDGDDE